MDPCRTLEKIAASGIQATYYGTCPLVSVPVDLARSGRTELENKTKLQTKTKNKNKNKN